MELGLELAASAKPLKPSLNIFDMVSKFAKVCKVRSIGVFNTPEIRDQIVSSNCGISLPAEDNNVDVEALHLVKQKENVYGDVEIMKMFETLLDLKLAYVKLQEAHMPYDPKKFKAADEVVVSQLESLGKIKKAYKEKLLKESESDLACSALLLSEIKVQERVLEKLKSRAKNKDKQVANLRRLLQGLEMRNKTLAEKLTELEMECFRNLDPRSLENAVNTVRKAIHDFSKPLIALMKLSGWDLDEAANAIQPSVVYAKRPHKKYMFEAYIARRMFSGFIPQPCFIFDSIIKMDDPIFALMEDPQSSFAEFCKTKYLSVVHPEMEWSFFGNLDHRNSVANGIHPFTPFYRAFVRMARCVWVLLQFVAFIGPKVEIFGTKQGSEFSDVHMEVVDELKEYKSVLDANRERCKVEFMVMPGFKVGETLVKSRVYISKR